MYSYLVCGVFFLTFVLFLVFVGRQISGVAEFSDNLSLGYVVYSVPVAIAGIFIQILNLPWVWFALLLGCEWLVLFGVSVVLMKKRGQKRQTIRKEFIDFLKDNWLVLLVTVLMVGMMLLYYRGFWLCNHQDDGYYITRVATLPFGETGGNYNYALGIDNGGFSSYLVNTWELEASVYVYILGIDVTLFLRLFQSAFHFCLLANLLKAFANKVMLNSGISFNRNLAQYPVVIILLFNVYYLVFEHTQLLKLQDLFHMNTGMYLGFSVIRTMGILMLLLFFMDREKINLKMIAGVASISVVLISKSSVALPMIVIIVVSSLLVWLFTDYDRKGKIFTFIICVGMAGLGFVLPASESIQETVYIKYIDALKSPVLWVCGVIFLFSFTLRIRVVNRINAIFCVACLLTIIPEINDIVECFSVYNFVGARTVSTLAFFFIMLSSVYLCILLKKVCKKEKTIVSIYLIACVGIVIFSLVGFKLYGGEVIPGKEPLGAGFRTSLNVLKENIYFMPDSTIELGEKLDDLSEESEDKINVITPSMVIVDHTLHPLPVVLRTYAPDIVPISAVMRFPISGDSALANYQQQYYDTFIAEPSDETYKLFKEEIKDLDVNCIVVYDDRCSAWLEEDGFELYTIIGDGIYRVWYKEE